MIGNQNGVGNSGNTQGHSPEVAALIGEKNKLTWANKTPKELALHSQKISEARQGSEGNIENLKKGWVPEVRAIAVAKSADLRRGIAETEEHRKNISDGLKRAYAEGKRKPLSPEAKALKAARISAAKRAKKV